MVFRNGDLKMNNKRGGVGAKVLLVIILMLLSAIGGAYGYRVMDGKMAVREAQKVVKDVDVADYDTEEAAKMQVYIENVNKDIETAQTRKEVYEIMDEFKEDVAGLQTKAEKELEAAKREAEQARNANNSNNNSGINNDNTGSGDNTGSSTTDNSGSTDTGTDSGYKDNNLSNAQDGTEDSGLLNNLFGGSND